MKMKIVYPLSAALIAVVGLVTMRPERTRPAPTTIIVNITPPQHNSPVAGYRHWIRVNSKPHQVFASLALLCNAPSPAMQAEENGNPHLGTVSPQAPLRQKYVTVYVNKIAEHAMLHEKNPKFPVGSVIVKEKLDTPKSAMPELLTVMRKREKGYRPAAGDWEYLVVDGAGKEVQAQGHLQNCESCHAKWKTTDYVSRGYITDKMTLSLK